jgi:tetratricopeptide (TPR) repeat protein
MGRASALGVFVFVVLGPIEIATAGGSQAGPPVRVVAPSAASGIHLERDDLPPPPLEVIKQPVKVDTPPVPTFELPIAEPGFRTVRELRVRGARLLGAQVKVKGYVTWMYDCTRAFANANPGVEISQIQSAIRNDPTLCERPMFSLGDTRDTSRDASILVVEVTSGPKLVPGDHVEVTGTWATPSPHADSSDGVLTYGAMERVAPPASAASDAPAVLKELEIDLDPETKPAMRRFVDDPTLSASIERLNACNKAIAAKQYDAGIADCQAALEIWQDNHLAWYAWASAHLAKREWSQARALLDNTVTLRPDVAMYQLYHGIALYETERQQARQDQARKTGKKPEDVELDPAALNLDAARDALLAAVKLAPELWRAHYYLGRIHRDLDEPRRAAQRFTAAIRNNPGYRFGYIALSELYRRWDYLDHALAVATLGTTRVPAAEVTELWFEVAMVHDAKHANDKAIEAFGKVIAGRPDDAISKLQRGQLYFHKGDLVNARRDLEDVRRSPDPRVASAKPLASQLLAQIDSNKGNPRSREASWDCRRRGSALVCRPMITQGSKWVKTYRPSRAE